MKILDFKHFENLLTFYLKIKVKIKHSLKKKSTYSK